MNAYLIVFLGAGLGGMLRHGANILVPKLMGSAFPYHTLSINIVGSLAMGLFAGFFALKADPAQDWRLFLTTGVCGGFTTFSAFSLDAVLLYERGDLAASATYIVASVLASLAALVAGLWIMRAVYG
jgi:CrcB protein